MSIINDRFGNKGAAKPRRRGDVIEGKPKGSKRAPVLFCVDASYSMMSAIASEKSERTRMDLLNDMIRGFVEEILKDDSRDKVEVAFMVFADKILMETDFARITHLQESDFNVTMHEDYIDNYGNPDVYLKKLPSSGNEKGYLYPVFKVAEWDAGTDIGAAVLRAVEKLMKRKEALSQWGSYPATLILVTDGNPEPEAVDRLDDLSPDEKKVLKAQRAAAQEKAINAVAEHCYTHVGQDNLILPFIIGIGDESYGAELLDRYAGQLVNKAFHIRDNKAEKCFKTLVKVLCKSVGGSTTSNDVMQMTDRVSEAAEKINTEQDDYEAF